ncbi:hypothetical protein OEZ86_004339 [Tetradesmus obliquus]|nr:hypothetical protein OEZ86_004339 [Tetradesmus obliquus]
MKAHAACAKTHVAVRSGASAASLAVVCCCATPATRNSINEPTCTTGSSLSVQDTGRTYHVSKAALGTC